MPDCGTLNMTPQVQLVDSYQQALDYLIFSKNNYFLFISGYSGVETTLIVVKDFNNVDINLC